MENDGDSTASMIQKDQQVGTAFLAAFSNMYGRDILLYVDRVIDGKGKK